MTSLEFKLDWAYAYGKPTGHANFKQEPEDFQVHEYFSWPFSGEGEHILVKVEKRGLNTEELVRALARRINKPQRLISYAGLKDRQALTTQWLSIHAPGEQIEGLEGMQGPGWRILEQTRHLKKLKPGYLSGNHFVIRLKQLSDFDEIETRLAQIRRQGVPNYFGLQRFGRDGGNLQEAQAMLVEGNRVKDRFLKGMYLSAARSWLFNLILSSRVELGNWNEAVDGDMMQLAGSQSIFYVEKVDELLRERVRQGDLSPASPLAGKYSRDKPVETLNFIQDIYTLWQPWVQGLIQREVDESWRANCLRAQNLEYQIEGNDLILIFDLEAGCYATTLLRELIVSDSSLHQ